MALTDIIVQAKNYLNSIFDPSEEKENEAETIENILKGINFRGSNLWVLIFAIFIASLGLNVNSTAVIIGAMLISPLPFISYAKWILPRPTDRKFDCTVINGDGPKISIHS